MPVSDFVFVSLVVLVFASFMLVLAWGAYQTRNLPKD